MFRDGKFNTPSGRIEFYTEKPSSRSQEGSSMTYRLPTFLPPVEAWPDSTLAKKYPLSYCQSGSKFRVHTQYFNTPWLREIDPSPSVEMNPTDATTRGITEADIVEVFNDRGSVRLKAKLNDGIRPGTVNIKRGWARTQFIAGHSQALVADYRNPVTLNCSFFDTLVEVRKV
jgi:molybdopterin-containing oxidoreductase family molybdopterin binding subunit